MSVNDQTYIRTKGLSLTTPMGVVYENVDISVNKGEVVALFGTEGSGKTSLLLTLSARMRYKSGVATVAGFDLKRQHRKVRDISNITLVHRVNDVPENARCRDILSAELQVVGKSGRRAKVEQYFEDWNIAEAADVKFKDLDSYTAKRFDIALACAGEPQILMVDDIQNGLTQHQSLRIIDLLRGLAQAKGVTVVIGTVEYDIARHCDKVIVFSPSAERQHQACVADNGPSVECVVCGTGNGVAVSSAKSNAASRTAENRSGSAVSQTASAQSAVNAAADSNSQSKQATAGYSILDELAAPANNQEEGGR